MASQRPPDWDDAERAYVEAYGHLITAIHHHRLMAFGQLLGNILLCAAIYVAINRYSNIKPLTLSYDNMGRVEVHRYEEMAWAPPEHVIKYYLRDFVKTLFTRNRRTIENDYLRATAFLSKDLGARVYDAWKAQSTIRATKGRQDDVDIEVTSAQLEPLKNPPYRAHLTYDEVIYDDSHVERGRIPYSISVDYQFAPIVPTPNLPINPIGLTVVDYHEDAAGATKPAVTTASAVQDDRKGASK